MSLVRNPNASREYAIAKEYLAGVVLSGPEVKSIRLGQASLRGSYVKVLGTQAVLINAQITPYKFADTREYDPKRTRKLLLKKKELYELLEASQQKGTTLVPLAFEVRNKKIKLRLGVGRGKKEYEKRAAIKKREQDRALRKQFKDALRLK